MLKLRIGSSPWLLLTDVKESWINQQIKRYRDNSEEPCVQVKIDCDGVDIILSTPSCGPGSGGRKPNPKEQVIFDLWRKFNLYDNNFTTGNVIAFLKQAEKTCR